MFVIVLMFQDIHFSIDVVRWLRDSENGILLHRASCFGSQAQVLLVLKINQNWYFEVRKNMWIHTPVIYVSAEFCHIILCIVIFET
jgi:hypothetical protein